MSRETLHKITSIQQWNGSFTLDSNFENVIGLKVANLQRDASSKGWNGNAYASVVALVYLKEKLPGLGEDWELIADKTRNWLLNNYREQADDMFDAAMKLF